MVKQKIILKVSMHCDKCRSKAMRIVVGFSGVESASLKGDDKSQIEVTGDGVDVVALTTALRKKVGHAVIVNVGPSKDDKKTKEERPPLVFPWVPPPTCQLVCPCRQPDPCYDPCSIM